MTERYKKRHWKEARSWASLSGDPKEIATRLVQGWHDGNGMEYGYRYVEYPDTEEFKDRIARMIDLVREDKTPEIVEDSAVDSLCEVCHRGRC